jgi:hypothetical protein
MPWAGTGCATHQRFFPFFPAFVLSRRCDSEAAFPSFPAMREAACGVPAGSPAECRLVSGAERGGERGTRWGAPTVARRRGRGRTDLGRWPRVVPLLWTAPGRGQGRAVSSASAIVESGPRQSRSASSAYPIGGFLFGFCPSFLFSLLYIHTLPVHLYSPHPHGTKTLLPIALLALVFPLHAMWFRGCVKGL